MSSTCPGRSTLQLLKPLTCSISCANSATRLQSDGLCAPPAAGEETIYDVGIKDGAFLATFGKGAIGRARSESRSTFVSKLMHEHLATEARQEMWAGQAKGSVTCGCGCVLSWAAPDEVSCLQWHMLECGLANETAIRTRWHTAVRAALAKRIKRRDVVDGIMACWAMTAGRIHTAAGDQSRG